MNVKASQITGNSNVYGTISGKHQRKHQNSALLTFVKGLNRGLVESPHRRPVMRKVFSYPDIPVWGKQFMGQLIKAIWRRRFGSTWVSCQIRKIAGAHAPGMPGTFSPPPRVSDPDMHHGTCVTHVPWCMPGSLTSSFLWSRRQGKNVPGIPGACTTRNFTYLVRGPWDQVMDSCLMTPSQYPNNADLSSFVFARTHMKFARQLG